VSQANPQLLFSRNAVRNFPMRKRQAIKKLEAAPRDFTFGDVPHLTAALRQGDEAGVCVAARRVEPAHQSLLVSRWRRGMKRSRGGRAGDVAARGGGTFVCCTMKRRFGELGPRRVRLRHAATDLRRREDVIVQVLRRFAEWWQRPAGGCGDG